MGRDSKYTREGLPVVARSTARGLVEEFMGMGPEGAYGRIQGLLKEIRAENIAIYDYIVAAAQPFSGNPGDYQTTIYNLCGFYQLFKRQVQINNSS